MSKIRFPRRQFLALGAAGLGGTLLNGCDRLSESSDVQEGLSSAGADRPRQRRDETGPEPWASSAARALGSRCGSSLN